MRFFYSCLLSLATITACFAQQQYTFSTYSEEQGLPSGSINRIFKDANGFLWLWGEQSIARFDGYNFKIFRHNPDDTTSLPNNNIINAYAISNGDIYINFEGGLRCFYDPQKSSFTDQTEYAGSLGLQEAGIATFYITLKRDLHALYFGLGKKMVRTSHGVSEYVSLPPGQVMQAASDSSDFLLLNDAGKVFVFKPDEKIFAQVPIYDRSGKPDTTVYEIYYCDEQKNYIAISKKHFYRFHKNEDRFIPSFDLHQSSFGGQLYRNKYFAFMDDGKLYKLDIQTGEEKIIHLNKKIPEKEIKNNALTGGVMDKQGLLWIKSHSMGLFRYDMNTDRYDQFINEPGNPGSIPSNAIHEIYPDDEGMAWILCLGVGLVKIEPVVHVMERLNPAAPNKENVIWDETKNIRSFLETPSGYLVGSLGGLYNYDATKKEFSELTGMIGPRQTIIGAMARDESGNTWVGTWEAQLSILNPQNNRSISPELPFRKFRVRDLICDHNNTMWIATEGGGMYTVNATDLDFNNPASLRFNPVSHDEKNPSTISSDVVYTVIEDADGNILAGTDNGLNRYDRTSNTWTHYSILPGDDHSIHGNDVRALAFDMEGTLWIGTDGGGLNRYNKAGNNFTHFTTENGLPDDAIYTILCDNDDMLWLGTNRGLCRFNPEDYSCKNFTLKDGIQNYEFNTGAALKLKDGRLLFGGVDGYNVIDPGIIKQSLSPPVVISSIKIFDREIAPGDGHVTLTHTENSITFEFAALSFYHNQDNRYAYRMDGIDHDWIYSNDRRFVTYSNLRPGDYTFSVKASNSDGVWNEKGAQQSFTITPPWWATWWFRLLMLFVVVSGVVVFFRSRTASFRKQKLILESTVEERTADLRKQREISEQQRLRAEQSEQFKQQFLANMSHEIRTPMNAVMGMTHLLIEKNPRSDQFHYLDGIQKSADNLLHIIDDILDLSKIEAGKMELEKIDFSVHDLVEHIKQTLHYKAKEKGLQLITAIDAHIPDIVMGDPVRLNQVLMNLTGNALKFTEKGSVTIEIKYSAIEDAVLFSIIDTGIGIPKDKLQTVFESFAQANASDTRIYGGTGLGLSISKQLVELMEGKISITSEEGAGTIFSFEIHLPVGSRERMQEQKSSQQIDGSILDGLKILVVDDNAFNRIVVHDTLKIMAQVEIFQATNGQEAIAAVDQQAFDIILMDVQMPLMNGYQATKHIREKLKAPKNAIPVIALTASVIRSDLDKCRAAGMNDYVPKPIQPYQLIAAIAKLTGREIKLAAKNENQINHEQANHSPVTNLSYLENFCQGDKKQMQKYITRFTSTAPVLIVNLTTARLKNDFAEIAHQVHHHKTKWMMMGMSASTDLATRIEQQCREKEPGQSVSENVLKLIEQIQSATTELT